MMMMMLFIEHQTHSSIVFLLKAPYEVAHYRLAYRRYLESLLKDSANGVMM